MMGNETIPATDVENVCAMRENTGHFEGHIVRTAHLSSASHAPQAPLDVYEWSCH
jgi:hypothetical protein